MSVRDERCLCAVLASIVVWLPVVVRAESVFSNLPSEPSAERDGVLVSGGGGELDRWSFAMPFSPRTFARLEQVEIDVSPNTDGRETVLTVSVAIDIGGLPDDILDEDILAVPSFLPDETCRRIAAQFTREIIMDPDERYWVTVEAASEGSIWWSMSALPDSELLAERHNEGEWSLSEAQGSLALRVSGSLFPPTMIHIAGEGGVDSELKIWIDERQTDENPATGQYLGTGISDARVRYPIYGLGPYPYVIVTTYGAVNRIESSAQDGRWEARGAFPAPAQCADCSWLVSGFEVVLWGQGLTGDQVLPEFEFLTDGELRLFPRDGADPYLYSVTAVPEVTSTPEPSSRLLQLFALLAIAGLRRTRAR